MLRRTKTMSTAARLIHRLLSHPYPSIVSRQPLINSPLKFSPNSIPVNSIRFMVIPHRSISNFAPQKIDNFGGLVSEALQAEVQWGSHGDKRHWFVVCGTLGYEFATEHALLDYYIKLFARFVSSEEEAKQKIYLVSVSYSFGFGVEMDEDTKKELQGLGFRVVEDCYYATRNKDPSVRPAAQFTSVNMNHRLENIFDYHYQSVRNSEWNSDHWLVIPKKPDGGLNSNSQVIHFNINMLAEIIGSEKEAKERIYIIWYDKPFGFAATIDEETSNKLKDHPDVLQVIPDYTFDLKRDGEALMISSSPGGLPFCYYCLREHDQSECEYWDTLFDEVEAIEKSGLASKDPFANVLHALNQIKERENDDKLKEINQQKK